MKTKSTLLTAGLMIMSTQPSLSSPVYELDIQKALTAARAQLVVPESMNVTEGTLRQSEEMEAVRIIGPAIAAGARIAAAAAYRAAPYVAKEAQKFINRGGGPGAIGGTIQKVKEIKNEKKQNQQKPK